MQMEDDHGDGCVDCLRTHSDALSVSLGLACCQSRNEARWMAHIAAGSTVGRISVAYMDLHAGASRLEPVLAWRELAEGDGGAAAEEEQ
jgi:uncharacterized UBP type Zn finger protein